MSKEKQVILTDKIDDEEYIEIKEHSEELNKTINSAKDNINPAKDLSKDLFSLFYKRQPRKKKDIPESLDFQEHLVDKTRGSNEYERMKLSTRNDKFESTIATKSFLKKLSAKVENDDDLQELNGKSKQIQQQQREMNSIEQKIQQAQSDTDDLSDKELEKLQEQLEKLEQQQQENIEELKEEEKMNSSTIRQAIRDSVEKANDEAKKVKQLMSGWGMSEGDIQRISFEDKIKLAKRLEDKQWLKDVADLIGSMKRASDESYDNKENQNPSQIVGIEHGDDLDRVVTSDMSLLSDEDTEDIFFQKAQDEKLTQYEVEDYEGDKEGSMIVCVDSSGSMTKLRTQIAKAIAFGLYNIAQREDRPFIGILFSDSSNCEVYNIDKAAEDEQFDRILDFIETDFDGGTNFDVPLQKAVDLIEEEYDTADIVFTTDGQAKVSDQTLSMIEDKKQELKEFSIYGIAVTKRGGGLNEFSDNIYSIKDLLTEKDTLETSKQLFKNI